VAVGVLTGFLGLLLGWAGVTVAGFGAFTDFWGRPRPRPLPGFPVGDDTLALTPFCVLLC
jgi:hypothetical protein